MINDNPQEDFQIMVDSIKEQARLIQDVAIKGHMAEGRIIRTKLESYGRLLIEGFSRTYIELSSLMLTISRDRGSQRANLEKSFPLQHHVKCDTQQGSEQNNQPKYVLQSVPRGIIKPINIEDKRPTTCPKTFPQPAPSICGPGTTYRAAKRAA
jgi:hypothetical protein